MSVNRFEEQEILAGVAAVLDEVLTLGPTAQDLRPESPLLGALPELDSQAVLNVLMALEEKFDITFEDEDLDAAAFENLASLKELVVRKTPS